MKKKNPPRLFLDMPFGEAVERFIGVKPEEMEANIIASKSKKPPGSKRKRKPSGGDKNVVQLRERRMRKRNYGR